MIALSDAERSRPSRNLEIGYSAEGDHLHDPLADWTDWGGRAVAASGRHHLVFRDVAIW